MSVMISEPDPIESAPPEISPSDIRSARLMTGPPNSPTGADQKGMRPPDPCVALQGFLMLDGALRMFIWGSSLAFAFMLANTLGWWPQEGPFGATPAIAWAWGGAVVKWVVLVNLIYVTELMLMRLPIPSPKPGIYSTIKPPDIRTQTGRQLIYSCMIALLTKARYEAPFPAFLVFHISNIWPIRFVMGRIFGPRSKSCYVTDPLILDPHLVEIGRNVVIGSGANIAGHCQLPDMVVVRKTIIEDDVVIGANSTIFGGVHIKRGAMIAAGSVVSPFTMIGECEYWSGVPAVKLRDLPPPRHFARN